MCISISVPGQWCVTVSPCRHDNVHLYQPSRHGHRLDHVYMVTSQATHPIPCESRSTRIYAVPGCMDTHGITWRTTACAWVHACLGCTWRHMGPWPHGILPGGGCFHGHTCPCTHDIAWKRLYGSCGSMTAWSDMGPAPAVVCRWLQQLCHACLHTMVVPLSIGLPY